MTYYLHRINVEIGWSNPLLKEKNLLSIGWADFANSEYWQPHQDKPSHIPEAVDKWCRSKGWGKFRGRHGLKRFLEMKEGDRVIVPTWGAFHVYEIAENKYMIAKEVKDFIDDLKSWSGKKALINDGYLFENDDQKKKLDLGFFRLVKKVQRSIPRSGYADSALTSRMKVRQTNVEITDLRQSVEQAIDAFRGQKPINLREIVLEECATKVREAILEKLNPDKFERLIKAYLDRQGAETIIPAKNEREKSGDADVVATFCPLNIIINVQAKHHHGKTDDWAVKQIDNYRDNKEEELTGDGFTQIAWVISTAESFTEKCEELARTEGVRLINGIEFSKMLLDAGMEQLSRILHE